MNSKIKKEEQVKNSSLPQVENTYTEEDYKLISQLAEMMIAQAFGAKERNADGFEFSMTNPETNKEFFKVQIVGESFQEFLTEEGFVNIMANIAPLFLTAFKSEFKIVEE